MICTFTVTWQKEGGVLLIDFTLPFRICAKSKNLRISRKLACIIKMQMKEHHYKEMPHTCSKIFANEGVKIRDVSVLFSQGVFCYNKG